MDFPRPGDPGIPEIPGPPRPPGPPAPPPGQPGQPGPAPGTRVWIDPQSGFQQRLYERLLEKRIVMATGLLDDDAATRMSAQLLALDAEGGQPIRLELQNLRADLPAALAVMGVLDVLTAPVRAQAGGEIRGAALGVLVSCQRRLGYPNASFALAEPRMEFDGTVTVVTERQRQAERMVDSLYYRIAEVTGREADEIRDDSRHGRTLSTAEAIGYGLIQARAERSQ